MTEKELEEMEMSVYFLKLFYHNKEEEGKRRYYGELLRMQTMQLLNIQLDAAHKIKRAEDVWKFPWEEVESEQLTEEQMKKRVKYLCELARKEL
jgi:hypothetical protein